MNVYVHKNRVTLRRSGGSQELYFQRCDVGNQRRDVGNQRREVPDGANFNVVTFLRVAQN